MTTDDAVCERCGHARNQHSRAEFRAPERCRAPDCGCPEFQRGWFPSDELLAGLGLRNAPPDETTGRLGLECYAPGYEATCPQCGDRHVTLMRVPGGPWLCWPCAHAESFRDERAAPNLTCGCGCLCAEHLDAVEDLAKERAAHAAQLVALREDCVRSAQRVLTMLVDGRSPFSHAREILDAIYTTPTPDAEAALARVREEAVREERKRCAAVARAFRGTEPLGDTKERPCNCAVCFRCETLARAIEDALNA